jgi:hypothetical protein
MSVFKEIYNFMYQYKYDFSHLVHFQKALLCQVSVAVNVEALFKFDNGVLFELPIRIGVYGVRGERKVVALVMMPQMVENLEIADLTQAKGSVSRLLYSGEVMRQRRDLMDFSVSICPIGFSTSFGRKIALAPSPFM